MMLRAYSQFANHNESHKQHLINKECKCNICSDRRELGGWTGCLWWAAHTCWNPGQRQQSQLCVRTLSRPWCFLCSTAVDDLISLCSCFVLASKALNSTEQALLSGDEDRLYNALRSPALGLQSLQAQNKGWYLKQLLADREQKEQVNGCCYSKICRKMWNCHIRIKGTVQCC